MFIKEMSASSRYKASYVARAGLIAAVYAVFTMLWPFSYGIGGIDVRLSECMCVLPMFMPEAVPGLFAGCLISNLAGGGIIDAVFGSLTTLCAAYLTRRLAKWGFALACIPPVALNGLITGTVVYLLYTQGAGVRLWLLTMLSVTAGEAVSVYGPGMLIAAASRAFRFRSR